MQVSSPVAASHMQVLRDIIAGRSIAYTPYSVGYFEFAGFAMRLSPRYGLEAAQSILYILTVLFSYWTLVRMGSQSYFPLLGGIAVALYPNLILAISRFQDTGISCFLLSLFAWFIMRLRHSGLSLPNAILGGIVFGLTLIVRSNALTLVPLALLAAFTGRRFVARDLLKIAFSTALTIGIMALAIVPVKGRFVVFDRFYGAYTFLNGTHEHAFEGMVRDYNGEMAMPQSLQKLGLREADLDKSDDALADQYLHAGFRFILDNPLRYAGLELAKTANLFRPDLRNAEHSFIPPLIGKIVHISIAAIFFVWLVLRHLVRRTFRILDGFMLIPLLVLYLIPFIATNTDPRYRVPLDALLLVECVYCVELLPRRSNAKPAGQPHAAMSAREA